MASSPYRDGYRVEDQVRAPNADEWALIRERRARDRAVRRKNALGDTAFVMVAGAIGLAVAAIGLLFERPAVAFGAGLTGAFCLLVGFLGRQRGLASLAASRGRWDEADDRWRVHETRIRARSVLWAASDDEDYVTWVLFEIPQGQWAAVDDLWVPASGRPSGRLGRSEVRLRWLEPGYECIGVQVTGDALPRHGAVSLAEAGYDGDDFAAAVEAGFVWTEEEEAQGAQDAQDVEPAELEGERDFGAWPIRRVDEASLPRWMRGAVGRPA